jgi:hypothetical protein
LAHPTIDSLCEPYPKALATADRGISVVLMADLNAVERNIAAVCMGGLDLRHLSHRITGECPRIVAEMERAA